MRRCARRTEFDDLCRTFDEMNVDAFIFLTPDRCHVFRRPAVTRIAQPRVIVTSTHGGIGVQDGLRLMKSADRRRVSVVGMDQWSAMADVMHLVVRIRAPFGAVFRRSQGVARRRARACWRGTSYARPMRSIP